MSQRYFAVCAPGLEEPLLREIRALGGRKASVLVGGVEFEASNAAMYRVLLHVRLANRLVLRLDEFRARDLPELYNKTRRMAWERLLPSQQSVFVRSSAQTSRLIHTGRIAKAVEDALVDHFKEDLGLPAPKLCERQEDARQIVLARLSDDRCELSLDASGELLYRRGWRTQVGSAPMRESVAAACLDLAGYTPGEPVFDPTCGSGTFVLEAAQMARNIAAGMQRKFALMRWANFQAPTWDKLVEEARAGERTGSSVFFGADRDAAMVEAARTNARQAEVEDLCQFSVGDAQDMRPPCEEPGLVIANPPWGQRLEEDGVVRGIITQFARGFAGWRLALVLPLQMTPQSLAPRSGLAWEQVARFASGGLSVRLWMAQHSRGSGAEKTFGPGRFAAKKGSHPQ